MASKAKLYQSRLGADPVGPIQIPNELDMTRSAYMESKRWVGSLGDAMPLDRRGLWKRRVMDIEGEARSQEPIIAPFDLPVEDSPPTTWCSRRNVSGGNAGMHREMLDSVDKLSGRFESTAIPGVKMQVEDGELFIQAGVHSSSFLRDESDSLHLSANKVHEIGVENSLRLRYTATQHLDNEQSVVVIRRNDLNRPVAMFSFIQTQSKGWAIAIDRVKYVSLASKDANLIALSVLSLGIFFAIKALVNKYLQEGNENTKDRELQGYRNGCIDHDMVCSFGLAGLASSTTLFVYGFPLCHVINVDILPCCQKHDIELWCAQRSASDIDSDFVNCIFSRFLHAVNHEWSFLCRLLSEPIVVAYSLLLQTLLRAALALVPYRYPQFGGGGTWSCLCGGKYATYDCGHFDPITGKPRKLCDGFAPPNEPPHLDPRSGGSGEDPPVEGPCYPCYWAMQEETNQCTMWQGNMKCQCCKGTPGPRPDHCPVNRGPRYPPPAQCI